MTGFTAAPIPWPRVAPEGQKGGSGLWVNADLGQAIRTESAVALKHWFGVRQTCARAWRTWAGVVGHDTTPGTKRAVKAAADKGAEVTRGAEQPDEACEVRATNAKRLNLIRFPQAKRWPYGWTAEMDAKLGTVPDKVLAKRQGKSRDAVRARRSKLGIPPA